MQHNSPLIQHINSVPIRHKSLNPNRSLWQILTALQNCNRTRKWISATHFDRNHSHSELFLIPGTYSLPQKTSPIPFISRFIIMLRFCNMIFNISQSCCCIFATPHEIFLHVAFLQRCMIATLSHLCNVAFSQLTIEFFFCCNFATLRLCNIFSHSTCKSSNFTFHL